MKRLLSCNVSLSGELDTDKFTQAILQFRNTPDPSNGISPEEIIFGRPLPDSLPFHPRSQVFNNTSVRPIWRDMWAKREDTLRTRLTKQSENLRKNTKHLLPLQQGDHCHIQNQNGRFPRKWDKTGVVVQVNENDQYTVKVHGKGRLTLRNRKYLRKYQPIHNNQSLLPSSISESKDCLPGQAPADKVSPAPLKVPNRMVIDCKPKPIIIPSPETDLPSQIPSPLPTPASTQTFDSQATDDSEPLPEVRRSNRVRNSPRWHDDYVIRITCCDF